MQISCIAQYSFQLRKMVVFMRSQKQVCFLSFSLLGLDLMRDYVLHDGVCAARFPRRVVLRRLKTSEKPEQEILSRWKNATDEICHLLLICAIFVRLNEMGKRKEEEASFVAFLRLSLPFFLGPHHPICIPCSKYIPWSRYSVPYEGYTFLLKEN